MIGPGASREWSYSSPVGPVGGGLPKWRVLLVFLAVVGLLLQLPTAAVNADAWAEPNVGCTTNAVTIATVPTIGRSYVSVSYHLIVAAGGTISGRWESSLGQIGTLTTRSAGLTAAGDWWIAAQGEQIMAGTVATLRYVVQKMALYGGCFSVDHISVMTVAASSPQGSYQPGSSGEAIVTPDPSMQSPGAEPSGGFGAYDCNGSSDVANCDAAPAGWCWVQTGAMYGSVGYKLIECVAPTASPSPPAGAASFTSSCTTSWNGYGEFCTINMPALQTGDVIHLVYGWVTIAGASWAESMEGSGYNSGGVFDKHFTAAGFITTGNLTVYSTGLQQDPRSAWIVRGNVQGYTHRTMTVELWITSGPSYSPPPSNPPSGPPPSGWPSYPPMPTIAPPNFAWPSYPAFGWPSYPPFPSGGPVNICAAASPGGPTPNIAACAQVPSSSPGGSGSPGSSIAYGVADPSAALTGFSELLDNLGNKVPFGYVTQAVDAVGAAAGSAAGGGLNECVALDWWHPGGTSTAQWCIPWDQVGTWAAPIRFVLLAVLMIGVAVAFIGIARSTAEGAN